MSDVAETKNEELLRKLDAKVLRMQTDYANELEEAAKKLERELEEAEEKEKEAEEKEAESLTMETPTENNEEESND